MATMKAVMKIGKGVGLVEMREVPVPKPGPGDVLIEVKAVSICGSDVHIYHDAHPYWPPMILGHEFSGVIAGLGEGVESWTVGDRVVSETRTGSCMRCRYCESGNPQVCPNKRPPGIGRDGAYAKYLVMPARLLHRMPHNLSFEQAACVEPTAVCYHGIIERTAILPGDTVLISGPGPIGLLSLLLCRASGASRIVMVGTARSAALKLKKAAELGAETLISGQDNVVERILEMTDGYGADLVVEASGAPKAIDESFRAVRRQGRICGLGISGKDKVDIPWDVAIFKAAVLTFAFSSSWTSWEAVLRMMGDGQLNVQPLITHVAPLEDWEKIFHEIENGRVIKAILKP